MQIARVIDSAEVRRAEPTVLGEGLPRRIRPVAIPREDVRSAHQDFAESPIVRFVDAKRDAGERPTGGIEPRAPARIEGDDRAGLGQAVTGQDFPAETLQYRSEEHTSELQSLMRISYAGFCLK